MRNGLRCRVPIPSFIFAAAAALTIASATEAWATSLTWMPTGPISGSIFDHIACLLPNGEVLIAGGVDDSGVLASAHLYDPASRRWSFTGSMSTPRHSYTGTLLPDGRVLVTGGQNGVAFVDSAEVYDPATGQWSPTGSMSTSRTGHAAV